MPNYDFRCLTCNIIIEQQDRVLPPCPQCGEIMNRVWDAPAIKFKGSGFYSTGG
jgi:putative FmdB family regulatory protein